MILRCWLLALLACVAVGTTWAAAASEYQLKAVFLFNFAQFVEWPPATFEDAQDPLVVGVLGPDPFGPELDAIMQGEQINGRAVVVERYSHVDEIDDCQLLFINQSSAELRDSLAELKGRPILTVGDSDAFSETGGMIRFVTIHNRLRLQVNLRSTTDAQLRLSSKLLRSSQIVAKAEG